MCSIIHACVEPDFSKNSGGEGVYNTGGFKYENSVDFKVSQQVEFKSNRVVRKNVISHGRASNYEILKLESVRKVYD